MLVDFGENRFHVLGQFPVGIMRLELADITYIPDMIAHAIIFLVGMFQLTTGDFFAHLDRFEHRTITEAAAADVVDFA